MVLALFLYFNEIFVNLLISGYVNDILSAPILFPFSRVTYCAYLVHPIVIRLTAMNMDSPLHLGKDSIVSYIIHFYAEKIRRSRMKFIEILIFVSVNYVLRTSRRILRSVFRDIGFFRSSSSQYAQDLIAEKKESHKVISLKCKDERIVF